MGNVLVAAGSGAELWHEVRGPGEVLAPGAPVQRVQELMRFNAPDPRMLGRREVVLLGVFALLLHAGGLYWLGQRSTPPLPEVPVQIPPMTIEFASPAPPRVEPVPPAPAPLPEPPAPPAVEELAAKPPPKPVVKPTPPPKPKAAPKPVESKPTPPRAETPPAPPAPPATATPAPAPAPAPAAAPLTPPSASAGYLRNPAPEYPAIAQRRGWEGSVLLRVHVLASGTPSEIQVQKSSGRDLLDEAAVKAVRRWSFVPAKRGEVAQDGWVSVPIDFKLN